MPDLEHQSQVALFHWASYYPALRCMYAIPNAGKRSARAAAWYKAEGLRPGMPDVCVPIGFKLEVGGFMVKEYNALYIEMKTPKGRISPQQLERHIMLAEAGNYVAVCRSCEEAREVIGWCYPDIVGGGK